MRERERERERERGGGGREGGREKERERERRARDSLTKATVRLTRFCHLTDVRSYSYGLQLMYNMYACICH